MMNIAALVFGSSLMAMAGGADFSGDAQAAFDLPVELPTPGEVTRAKLRRASVNRFFGIALEFGSVVFHTINGGMLIGRDLKFSSAGCNAPDKPCGGPPFLLVIPAGATTMGWIGSARFAESREANLRNSLVYWLGTVVEIGAYFALAIGGNAKTREGRLAQDTCFVSMAALGTLLQVIGAFTGPTRAEVEAAP